MTLQLLAVSGSLQTGSSNAALLQAIVAELGGSANTTFTRALHDLPPFNVEADADDAPAAVFRWRAELAGADAVLMATPEYAFGIAGSLKNALDWVVGSGELVHKPVILIGASTQEGGAAYALEALERTVRIMSAKVLGTLGVPFVRAKLDPGGAIVDAELHGSIVRLAELLRDLDRSAAPLL